MVMAEPYKCNRCDKLYVGDDWTRCPFCDGSGNKADGEYRKCNRCDKMYVGDDWTRCPFCDGSGNRI